MEMEPEELHRPILLWVGASQVGKSTCIQLLTGNKDIKIGSGGISETFEIEVFKEMNNSFSQKYQHMDTIGFGDNKSLYENNDILEKIDDEFLKKSSSSGFPKNKAIIVVESFMQSTFHLPNVLKELQKLFNYTPSKSIIVLVTKKNMISSKPHLSTRQKEIKNCMRQFKIPESHYLQFKTPCQIQQIYLTDIPPSQIEKLYSLVEDCEDVQLKSFESKREKIKKRAKKLQTVQKMRTFKYAIKKDKIPKVLKYITGIGGGGVGGAVAGFRIGAYAATFATAGTSVGPVGTFVGGGVGVLIGLGISSLLSTEEKKQVYDDYQPAEDEEIMFIDQRYYPTQQECFKQALQDYYKYKKNPNEFRYQFGDEVENDDKGEDDNRYKDNDRDEDEYDD